MSCILAQLITSSFQWDMPNLVSVDISVRVLRTEPWPGALGRRGLSRRAPGTLG
jgi:hypothetical protein